MGSVEHLANKQLLIKTKPPFGGTPKEELALTTKHQMTPNAAEVSDPIAGRQRQEQGMHVMTMGGSCLACFLPEASLGSDFSSSFQEAAALWPGEQLVPLLQVL